MKTPPILIGLTGSIGMGKSTVAGFFAEAGVPVWDADSTVHALYQKPNAGFAAIAALAPDAAYGDAIDRGALSKAIAADPTLLGKIEAAIHPLVAQHRADFIADCTEPLALFDIPLIFENENQDDFDVIVVVDAGAALQKTRVLARPGMNEEKFATILARQIPNAQKVAAADFVVDTSLELAETQARVAQVLRQIKQAHQI